MTRSCASRRTRGATLLGMWAAEKLGLTGDAASAYAKDVVMAELWRPAKTSRKSCRSDFKAKGVVATETEIRRLMTEFLEKAIADIKAS